MLRAVDDRNNVGRPTLGLLEVRPPTMMSIEPITVDVAGMRHAVPSLAPSPSPANVNRCCRRWHSGSAPPKDLRGRTGYGRSMSMAGGSQAWRAGHRDVSIPSCEVSDRRDRISDIVIGDHAIEATVAVVPSIAASESKAGARSRRRSRTRDLS